MWQRQKGNGNNCDGQSTENCTVLGIRVFGDFHNIIKYSASPLQRKSTVITAQSPYIIILPNGVRPSSFSESVCKVFSICWLFRQMVQHG